MNSIERRAILGISIITAIRMLGLFMILPVFAIFAQDLPHATPLLIGIALGIYGLTQAILQIPFGLLSDHCNRKIIITLGLTLFILGSLVASFSETIYGMIAGRALQGTGAVSAVILALTADLTREQQRTKAMAIMGITFGATFVLALILGPLFNHWIGVNGIFLFSALIALLAIVILWFQVPTPSQNFVHSDTETIPEQLLTVLANRQLLRLNAGIFSLHAILTALFLIVPSLLLNYTAMSSDQVWLQFYLPVLLLAVIGMIPMLYIAERMGKTKLIFISAILLLLISLSLLWLIPLNFNVIFISLVIFFAGFTVLECLLPSLTSKIAPPTQKGTALGIYSTTQFLGIFLGGVIGGWVQTYFSEMAIFPFALLLALIWLVLSIPGKMQSCRRGD